MHEMQFTCCSQAGYGSTIVSFLGGIHWGAALSAGVPGPASRFLWGVTPSLLAWPLTVMDPHAAAASLCAILPALYYVDAAFAKQGLLPSWYMALRVPLTVLATYGVLLTATAYFYKATDEVPTYPC